MITFTDLIITDKFLINLETKRMKSKKSMLIVFVLINFAALHLIFGQNYNFQNRDIEISKDLIRFNQIEIDSLFDSNQVISLLTINKNAFDKFYIEISQNNSILTTTSTLGRSNNAVAAVNGSFYDMDTGESVTYFEHKDSVISRTRKHNLKWAKPDSLINGAIVITKSSNIEIQPANSDKFYESSKNESAVLISGPLLIHNSKIIDLPDMDFVNKRHPRTCLGETPEALILVVIDGRNENAEGMNLQEVQNFLAGIGCVNAINLDGGGSTTMWIKGKGIVNFPSDKSGERSVSNVLLIMDKHI